MTTKAMSSACDLRTQPSLDWTCRDGIWTSLEPSNTTIESPINAPSSNSNEDDSSWLPLLALIPVGVLFGAPIWIIIEYRCPSQQAQPQPELEEELEPVPVE